MRRAIYQTLTKKPIFAIGSRVAIRCGSRPGYTDSFGKYWIPDTYSYVTTGSVLIYEYSASLVTNTNDPELYYGIRYGNTIASSNTIPVIWGYDVPATPGRYTVKILFAELFNEPARIGHIDINGVRKLTNFDEVANAGGNLRASQIVFTNVQPVSGFINVGITSLTQNFYISALELDPVLG